MTAVHTGIRRPRAWRFGWADLLGPLGVASVVVVVCMWLRTGGLQQTTAGLDSGVVDSVFVPLPADTLVPPPPTRQFTLSFAALLRESSARELANSIIVNGNHPKVVQTVSNGAPIFRVVLGPFVSREEADRIGRQSGHNFWVYEGYP